jgi:hypothetical protein
VQTLIQLHSTLDVFTPFQDVTLIFYAAEMIHKLENALGVILMGYSSLCRVDELPNFLNVLILRWP